MRRIFLYGHLGNKYGKYFDLDVETAAEAVRALGINFPGFLEDVRDGTWRIVRGENRDKGYDLGEEDLTTLRLGKAPIHIIPCIAGAKNGGGVKMIIGAVIVAAAIVFSGGALAAPLASGGIGAGVTAGNIAMLGVSMMIAGASMMLSPEQSTDNTVDKLKSHTMNGPGGSYAEGAALPLVYGEVITGGIMVSGGVETFPIPATGGGSYVSGGKK